MHTFDHELPEHLHCVEIQVDTTSEVCATYEGSRSESVIVTCTVLGRSKERGIFSCEQKAES